MLCKTCKRSVLTAERDKTKRIILNSLQQHASFFIKIVDNIQLTKDLLVFTSLAAHCEITLCNTIMSAVVRIRRPSCYQDR